MLHRPGIGAGDGAIALPDSSGGPVRSRRNRSGVPRRRLHDGARLAAPYTLQRDDRLASRATQFHLEGPDPGPDARGMPSRAGMVPVAVEPGPCRRGPLSRPLRTPLAMRENACIRIVARVRGYAEKRSETLKYRRFRGNKKGSGIIPEPSMAESEGFEPSSRNQRLTP